MDLTRRTVIASAAAATAAALGPTANIAHAAAPPAGRQAPSFYRHRIGDLEVTIVSDGVTQTTVQPAMVKNASIDDIKASLAAARMPTDKYWNHFNPVLVNTGSKLVLLDAGNDAARAPTTGMLPAGLKAAGIEPKDIDLIVISHFHRDHIGGLRDKDGAWAFPNAEVKVPAPEFAFWMDDGNASRAQPNSGPANTFANARRIFGKDADRVSRYQPGAEVAPGISTIATPGHTPGHTCFIIASGPGRMIVQADVSGNPAINVRNPGWHTSADMDGPTAEATRRKLYDMVATDRLLISGYHHPFPASSHMEKDGAGYRILPVTWSPVL